ncbi:hypothetical protein Acsp02_71180 [Actinoplanes sp. NBRC 103695]|nr:hypothetical protein Acsp02_71180 [Actinoplanes sp. NBRC 103695]
MGRKSTSNFGDTVSELAAQLGIGDLEKFLRSWIAISKTTSGQPGSEAAGEKLKYTVAEVSELLGVSPRWLADQCRAERIEHIHIARRRYFTHDQIVRLLEKHAVEPFDDRPVDPAVARAVRRVRQGGLRGAGTPSRR